MDKDTLLKNVNQVKGITGSMLVSRDGLVLANSLPESSDPNLVSAILYKMFTDIDVQSKRMQRGQIKRLTIETEQEALSLMNVDLNGESLIVFSQFGNNIDLNDINKALDQTVTA